MNDIIDAFPVNGRILTVQLSAGGCQLSVSSQFIVHSSRFKSQFIVVRSSFIVVRSSEQPAA